MGRARRRCACRSRPGWTCGASDELRTGADARLLVKLADGSAVKLGESAQLRLATLQTRKDNVFVSAMSVLQAGSGHRVRAALGPAMHCR